MAYSTEVLVIDTSAIVAILFNEEEASTFFEQIRKSEAVWLSSVSKVETMMVLTSKFNLYMAAARSALRISSPPIFKRFCMGKR